VTNSTSPSFAAALSSVSSAASASASQAIMPSGALSPKGAVAAGPKSRKLTKFFDANDLHRSQYHENFWDFGEIVPTTIRRKTLRKTMLLQALSSYVPNLVMRYCINSQNLVTPPVVETYPAALLFADISGFTPLAEKLARQGARGVELLTMHLNEYFGQMINLIFNHGGDIVKFAGDALLAIWPTQDGTFLQFSEFGKISKANWPLKFRSRTAV